MKPLSALTSADITDVKLLSFDSDGVTIEPGTVVIEKEGVLIVKTKKISDQLLEKINRLKKYFHLNFTSGRSLLHLNRMYGQVLWEKASLQAENGLFTLIDGQVIQTDRVRQDELSQIEAIKAQIRELAKGNKNIKGFEPKQFLISVHCFQEDEGVKKIVRNIDKRNEFYIFWTSGEAYDIFPKRFSKGAGLARLADYLGISLSQMMAVGNDPNDQSAVDKAGVGITTSPETLKANFHTEKKYNLGGEEVVDHLLGILE